MINLAFESAIFAVLCWTIANVMVKKVSVNLGSYVSALIITAAGLVPMIVAIFITTPSWPGIYPMAISIIAGIFLFLGFTFAYKSLETEQLTSYVVIGEIQPALLVLIGLFALDEAVSTIGLISMALIFAGAFLVVTTERFKLNRRLIPAVLANVCWLIYWVLMTAGIVNSSSFAFQIFASRAVGLLLICIALVISPSKAKYKGANVSLKKVGIYILAIALIAGIIDGSGDTLFSLVINSNFVAIGSALSAISPILIAVLSYFIYGDRLTKPQALGFLIMVAGAVTLTLG